MNRGGGRGWMKMNGGRGGGVMDGGGGYKVCGVTMTL